MLKHFDKKDFCTSSASGITNQTIEEMT
jgi:hypothetical protein